VTKPAFTYPKNEPLIVFERVFAAPPALVWRAHTDPAMMTHWWGPRYLRNEVLEMDVRPGGAWRINQHAPDGAVHPFKGVYSKVIPFEQLDYTFAYADYPAVPITMRLEDLGDGRTRMLSVTDMGSMAAREGMLSQGMEGGALEGFDRLDTLLAQDKFTIVRRLAAPRELVWKAYTELERLAEWWGPAGFKWLGGELDLRAGGGFWFGMAAPDGSEMWARFAYGEVRPPERLTYTVAFTDAEGTVKPAGFIPDFPLEYMNVVTFAQEGDETVLTLEAWAVSEAPAELAAFAGLFESMQQGFGATFDQLEAYLAKEPAQ
jgi:uncharacterized protein YndB with AHSA1/START domain